MSAYRRGFRRWNCETGNCQEKCCKCGKPAEYNIQTNVYSEHYQWNGDGWRKVDSSFLETEDGENDFYCLEHYNKASE